MYDKTIASDHRIYEITVTSSRDTVYNLLSPEARAEYDTLCFGEGLDSNPPIPGRPNQKYLRVPVDGYLVTSGANFYISSSESGPQEQCYRQVQYPQPFSFWPQKLFVSGSGVVTVRILFS